MTYYEHFEVFLKILHLFRDVLKYERMAATKDYKMEYNTFAAKIVTEIDYCANLKDTTAHLESLLVSLYNTKEPFTKITIKPQGYQQFTYPLAKPNELHKSSAGFLCPFLFSTLNLDNFYEVLCSIYLEQTIIFFSENLNILTSCM